MKKQTKKGPATKKVTKGTVARARERVTATTASPKSSPAKAKRSTKPKFVDNSYVMTKDDPAAQAWLARQRKPAAVAPPPPPPAPAQEWRKKIDWVAAGRKAYETRMRNLAAKGQAPAKVASHPPPMAAPIARRRTPKPAAAPLAEGDTSRS